MVKNPTSGLDASSDIPLYRQLYHIFRRQIIAGTLPPGEQLPSERQLAAEHGISRHTVRQAMDLLRKEGLAYRQHGRGFFVAPVHKDHRLQLLGFSEAMEEQGVSHATRVEETQKITADETLAAHLNIKADDAVYLLKRVRLMYGDPIGVEWAYLPCAHLPDLSDYDFSQRSLYKTLEQELNIRLDHAEQTVRARAASPEECQLFHLPEPSAVLELERKTYDIYARVIEYVVGVYHPERYTLTFFLSRH
ncbi:MAG: GntR family transcriptional regulator [Anaerolineae bacterium]